MRRLVWIPVLLLVAGLTACSSFRDLFSAHADVAAEAGDQTLSPDRLAQIMISGKGVRPDREAANFVANVWIDYSLFGQAVASGKLPLDSASIAEAVWPQLAELKGSHWHDTLMARRSVLPPNAADSVYRGNDVRVLQHILYRVPPNAVPEVRNTARKKAEGTLARIKRGADFGQVASQVSEDPGSKADRGFLPPSPKGRFVPAFDSAGWSLPPGATSGVVETQFGYHIIKRPAADAVRDRLTAYLAQSAGGRLDSIYMDSLAILNQIKIEKGAASAMRGASENPEESRRSKKKLTTFKNGELTVGEFMRWMQALPPQYAAQLKQADDTMLTQFARVLSQNILLLRQADSARIRVTPEEWSAMAAGYRAQVDTLRAEMGLDTAALWDSTAAAADRNKVAAAKVEQYFDRLVSGKSRLRPLPSALATLLRDRSKYRVYDGGLNRSVELAQAERAKTDTSKAQTGPLQPAPGPAPIPGVTPPAPGAAGPPQSGKAPAPPGAQPKAGQQTPPAAKPTP
ncbi:MAG TPA: peptidylprolyl isomerase [Gemmatimonadales bacterium]|nr:peptidylprolyl isomerase [Gemmatimonadales bacterium]